LKKTVLSAEIMGGRGESLTTEESRPIGRKCWQRI